MPRRPPRTSRSPQRVLRAREKKAWRVAFYITVAHSHRPPRVLSGSDGDAQTLRIRKEYTGRGGPRRRPDERLSWYSTLESTLLAPNVALRSMCRVPIYRRGAVPAQRGAERSATVATVAFHTFFYQGRAEYRRHAQVCHRARDDRDGWGACPHATSKTNMSSGPSWLAQT